MCFACSRLRKQEKVTNKPNEICITFLKEVSVLIHFGLTKKKICGKLREVLNPERNKLS